MEITNLEHEFVDDLFFSRVDTRFYVNGMKHFYFTAKGEPRPQVVQWWEPNKKSVQGRILRHEYYSKCPAHIRAIVEEQVPIVAILLS